MAASQGEAARIEVNEQQHLSYVQPIDNEKDEHDAVAGNEDANTAL
jgi:hypothetical protein